MYIQICVNNRVIAEGLKRIILENTESANVSIQGLNQPVVNPDIVLFDSTLEIGRLKDDYLGSKFICLDLGLDDGQLCCLFCCHGVHAIISPTLEVDTFPKVLITVSRGDFWLEQSHVKKVLLAKNLYKSQEKTKGLSEQDFKIINLVTLGKKNCEIADELCLSEPTIKAHISRIYRTLNIGNRSSLISMAIKKGWSSVRSSMH